MGHNGKPYIIGITGGIASGKTTAVAYMLAQAVEMGMSVVSTDADEVSRALTAPGGEALPAIRAQFGDSVFFEDGTLNRRSLGQIVFADERKRHALESILHPVIQRKMIEEINAAAEEGAKLAFLSAPLLFETGMDALCDETWVFIADEKTQIERMAERDGLTHEQGRARIASQMADEERRARGDVLIRTTRPLEHTKRELRGLLRDAWNRHAE